MEKNVVTRIKSSENKPKNKVAASKAAPRPTGSAASSTATRSARRPARAKMAVEDAVYTQAHSAPPKDSATASAKHRIDHLIGRGKDLVSGDATSVAAAAAIVVGAALIEVELIPGLIIGAGAILLGKLFPEMGGYVRPAIKGAVRAGFYMTQKAQELMAETSEQVHDLVAEVVHEQKQPQAGKTMKPVPEPASGSVPSV